MPAAICHVSGERYGRLVLLEEVPSLGRQRAFRCLCACGTEKVVRGCDLRNGHTQSCGCLLREIIKTVNVTHGHTAKGSWSRTYMSWSAMRARTTNPNSSKWPLYGARGISCCERWSSFENFLADMGERPEGTTIDRIDVDGNYEPGNCRWATASEQMANRRPRRDEARERLQAAFGGVIS